MAYDLPRVIPRTPTETSVNRSEIKVVCFAGVLQNYNLRAKVFPNNLPRALCWKT